MSWVNRRKITYLSLVVLLLVGAIVVLLFLYFYEAPTCFDGIRNGNEQDVDCGGSCERLCQSSFFPPSISWTRFEELAPSLYNVATYIINQNTNGSAKNVPYLITLFDSRGVIIKEIRGLVTLSAHRNTLAFQSAIDVGQRVPAKAIFEFTGSPEWNKDTDLLSVLSIADKDYREEDGSSSLSVRLINNSLNSLNGFAVYAVLYDKDANAIGFSRTFIDNLGPKQEIVAPFTWPKQRDGKVVSIDVLPVSE